MGASYQIDKFFYTADEIDGAYPNILRDVKNAEKYKFFALLEALHVKTTHIETLLEHYESTDAVSMTAKIKSLESLATIKSPMKLVEGGWLPDFSSRYFVEDFPFGLKNIYDLAIKNNIECPYIRKVLEWGMSKMSN